MQMQRILSIDIFRGLTIFLMVLVNELAGVSGIPQWMKHVAPDVDGMTIVDVVFPAFLFIVGMAIPFAVRNREKKMESSLQFWLHILARTFALLVIGVFMVNAGEMNIDETLIPKRLWSAALYIAVILIWNNYPKPENKQKKYVFMAVRALGVLILISLYFVYRKGSGEELSGMTPSWWGILGLIGWAYLISVILYLISQKHFLPKVCLFLLMLGFLILLRSDFSNLSTILLWFKEQSGHITHTIIVMAGILCSMILAKDGLRVSPYRKIANMLILGILLLAGGYLSRPFGGISKIAATPAWALYSAAICCFVFPFIYWLLDIKKVQNWASFLTPAGKNPLLTYILPPLFYALFGSSFIPEMLSQGMGGFIRSLVFSLFILGLAGWLSKKGISIRL